jgi:hypothetical protein
MYLANMYNVQSLLILGKLLTCFGCIEIVNIKDK